MIEIDKAQVPLILPDPTDRRLTGRVTGTGRTGAAIELSVPVERRDPLPRARHRRKGEDRED
jgi:FdhD protein